jgi:hypothetical protein
MFRCPLLNAWYNSSGSEIGDICAWTGLADVNLHGTNFAMQPLWSNAANACVMESIPTCSGRRGWSTPLICTGSDRPRCGRHRRQVRPSASAAVDEL